MVFVFAIIAGIIGLIDTGLKGMLLGAALPFGWIFISYLEDKVFFLTTLDNFLLWKFVFKPLASYVIGPICAPIYIIKILVEKFVLNKTTADN